MVICIYLIFNCLVQWRNEVPTLVFLFNEVIVFFCCQGSYLASVTCTTGAYHNFKIYASVLTRSVSFMFLATDAVLITSLSLMKLCDIFSYDDQSMVIPKHCIWFGFAVSTRSTLPSMVTQSKKKCVFFYSYVSSVSPRQQGMCKEAGSILTAQQYRISCTLQEDLCPPSH